MEDQTMTKIASIEKKILGIEQKIVLLEHTLASAESDWTNNVDLVQDSFTSLMEYKQYLRDERKFRRQELHDLRVYVHDQMQVRQAEILMRTSPKPGKPVSIFNRITGLHQLQYWYLLFNC